MPKLTRYKFQDNSVMKLENWKAVTACATFLTITKSKPYSRFL